MSYVHTWFFNYVMNAAVTCEQFCCPHLSVKLVLGVHSFSLNFSLYSSRYTLYQVLAYFLWCLLPFHLATLPKPLYTTRWCFILSQPPFQILPEILYRINVWRLCWSLYHSIVMVIEPSSGMFAGILGSLSCLKMISSGVCCKSSSRMEQ